MRVDNCQMQDFEADVCTVYFLFIQMIFIMKIFPGIFKIFNIFINNLIVVVWGIFFVVLCTKKTKHKWLLHGQGSSYSTVPYVVQCRARKDEYRLILPGTLSQQVMMPVRTYFPISLMTECLDTILPASFYTLV